VDFDWTEQDDAFREELREFLRSELPPWYRGYDVESVGHSRDEAFAVSLDVTAKMAERGWLTQHWPKAWGGGDATIWQQVILREQMTEHSEPRGSQYMSVNWVGPAILMYGTEEQKALHLNAISEGRSCWAQGFSEPDAGSDLAALKTRAVRDGDEYVINGEKIWTSHTHRAQWIFLLARTDPDAPKHKGISVFLIPRDTPGIEIRPIDGLLGGNEFANTIFHDVRVPASCRLGPENEGWKVTLSALAFERGGVPQFHRALDVLAQLIPYLQTKLDDDGRSLWDNPAIRQRVARLRTETEVAKLTYYQAASQLEAGGDVSFINSLSRIHTSLAQQNAGILASELAGPLMDIDEADPALPLGGRTSTLWRKGLSVTVAAGTLEINKNTLATRGLGLPRD
jgi:alkylation response protein AidB-like acyl-CoA dehydrogenase